MTQNSLFFRIWTFLPGQPSPGHLPPMKFHPGQLPPKLLPPGQLSLNSSSRATAPRTIVPMKFSPIQLRP